MAEAVTSRVSALPAVGSDIQTGLSTAVGREDRCSLSSGDYLDKVGHVAGRSEARTVPVEHLSLFSTVYNVMPSCPSYQMNGKKWKCPYAKRTTDRSEPESYIFMMWTQMPR